ncbi:MAG: pilus assembly protein, partial [Planctomycetaceae bacterium]|nr:pilus assembly protein [Planctomycetaceae bacterium]
MFRPSGRRSFSTLTERRGGATTVELAIVLPVLFLFVFSAIEFSRLNMLRHLASVAAYEGARQGIVLGATADEAV